MPLIHSVLPLRDRNHRHAACAQIVYEQSRLQLVPPQPGQVSRIYQPRQLPRKAKLSLGARSMVSRFTAIRPKVIR